MQIEFSPEPLAQRAFVLARFVQDDMFALVAQLARAAIQLGGVPAGAPHCTVQYLDGVTDLNALHHQLATYCRSLRAFTLQTLRLEIGTSAQLIDSSVVWLAVEKSATLYRLYDDIGAIARALGFTTHGFTRDTWIPHIFLARFSNGNAPRLIPRDPTIDLQLRVRRLDLTHQLGAQEYERIASFDLP
ncbi:MAG: 2'-5' RNA ligase family protein [Chloroflexi bacterium]|nr:2'-5' RNA ligase family protein [Chloroflexota bacterium]